MGMLLVHDVQLVPSRAWLLCASDTRRETALYACCRRTVLYGSPDHVAQPTHHQPEPMGTLSLLASLVAALRRKRLWRTLAQLGAP